MRALLHTKSREGPIFHFFISRSYRKAKEVCFDGNSKINIFAFNQIFDNLTAFKIKVLAPYRPRLNETWKDWSARFYQWARTESLTRDGSWSSSVIGLASGHVIWCGSLLTEVSTKRIFFFRWSIEGVISENREKISRGLGMITATASVISRGNFGSATTSFIGTIDVEVFRCDFDWSELFCRLTYYHPVTLRIDLEDFEGNTAWAEYKGFR